MATAKTDFSLSLNTVVDTSKIQKLLSQKKYKIQVELDTANIVKSAEKNIKSLYGNFKNLGNSISSDMQRINTQIQTGLTGTNGAKNLVKYTETFKNSLGDISERVTVLTSKGKILSTQVNEIAKGVQKITTETQNSIGVTNGYSSKISTITKTITDTSGATKQIIKTTSQWVDSNNRLHTSIKTVDENGRQLAADEETIVANTEKVTAATKTAATAQKSLAASFVATIGKVAKFYIATLPIQAVSTLISQAKEAITDFDSAQTEMKKVTDLSSASLDTYIEKLTELGETVGRTTTTMTELTTNFLKAGYDEDTAAELAQVAAMYQNTADEELSASDATAVLVSQLKAYEDQGLSAIEITDEINEISAEFAVSSGDIGKGLTAAGAALSTYGNSFYETTSLLTAGTEIFQGM